MVDPTRAKLARLLKVSDADIWSFEYSMPLAGFVVEMRTGGDVLVTDEKFYALDDHRGNKGLPRFKGGEPSLVIVDEVPEPETTGEAVEEDHDESPFVPEGTSGDIMVWVDGDPERAKDALAKEREREKPRVALIKQLERIMDGG